jgi:hypothetical protein
VMSSPIGYSRLSHFPFVSLSILRQNEQLLPPLHSEE